MILGLIVIGFILILTRAVAYSQKSKLSNTHKDNFILVGLKPEEISVDPIAHKVYVTNPISNTVSAIDGLQDRVIGNTHNMIINPADICRSYHPSSL